MRNSQRYPALLVILTVTLYASQVKCAATSENDWALVSSSGTAGSKGGGNGLNGQENAGIGLGIAAAAMGWSPAGWALGLASLITGVTAKNKAKRINNNKENKTANELSSLNKTLSNTDMNAYQGFISSIAQKPVLEILYAWQGYDMWEAYGSVWHAYTKYNAAKVTTDHKIAFDNNSKPITDDQAKNSYKDITKQVQIALTKKKTGLYITRDLNTIIAPTSHNGHMYPADITKHSFTLGYNSALRNPRLHSGGIKPALIIPSCSNDAAFATEKTIGIVYRDGDGIHFRRFEGWQNIALPMVESLRTGPLTHAPNCGGGYFYGHQFEEVGRGLITATLKGPGPLNFFATDRFGWAHTFHDGTKFCPGVGTPLTAAGSDMYLISKETGRPWHTNQHEMNLFCFSWGPTGSTLRCKPSGFPAFPDNDDGGWVWHRANIAEYQYHDENGQFQKLKLGGANTDPSINEKQASALIFPGSKDQTLDVWFALDRTTSGSLFTMGTGAPVTEDDFSNDAVKGRILYQKNVTTSPYLRNFAFSSDDSTMLVYNIESRRLNPTKKFCTPPFLKGNFLFWHEKWQIPTPDTFSITFKARGRHIHIGLSSKEYAERIAEGKPFDTSYDYAIRVDILGSVIIEKCVPGLEDIMKPGVAANVITKLPVKMTASMPGGDNESYNDYWLSYSNGVIQFGTGETVGKQIVAQAVDQTPTLDISTFCFSSDIRTTDYINISPSNYSSLSTPIQGPSSTPGIYTNWTQTQRFPTNGRGAFVFSYLNTVPTDQNPVAMIGLNNIMPAAGTAIVPHYQILLGTQNNTAHEIMIKSNSVSSIVSPVKDDGTTTPVIKNDNAWHDMWVLYDTGTIMYGTGNILGQNTLAFWQDPLITTSTTTPPTIAERTARTPMNSINIFSFTTLSNSLNFRFNYSPKPASQKIYSAPANTPAKWLPLWQFTTPNRGLFCFTACGTDKATAQIGILDNVLPLSTPNYEIVINDAGTAYIRKQRTQQASSTVTLQSAQKPSATGTLYWIGWFDGLFVLGTGNNPLNRTSIILKWQDPTPITPAAPPAAAVPNLTRFTLAALNNLVTYKAITFFDPSVLSTINNGTTTTPIIAMPTVTTTSPIAPTMP